MLLWLIGHRKWSTRCRSVQETRVCYMGSHCCLRIGSEQPASNHPEARAGKLLLFINWTSYLAWKPPRMIAQENRLGQIICAWLQQRHKNIEQNAHQNKS